MKLLRFLKSQPLYAIGFVAILFIRSLGLLALFQHAPLPDGFGGDRHYFKKINVAKTDHSPGIVAPQAFHEILVAVSQIIPLVDCIGSVQYDRQHSLRSPPLLPLTRF